ncbi:NAD-dependent succinate-semialdehyde dehydrogenase [Marinobacterium arenosum]|uniref:NAD-dependent succinate-semialdehyde dehydrogenase n=1 Tax=Marinobacterium arenosum TaxID=2862496 RepID=UPI001C954CA9|nr:NAD-dependent succinate-semialdehyde dehydrogenase [Marinobacterium arenosum]MBY4678469.1 NAD-dependent succinate-semialdehyde dehydrogenase [Marinobacterium arenosum]
MSIQLKDSSLLKTQAYINGQWLAGDNGETFAVSNPATGEQLAEVASVGAAETRRAIEAAEQAMQAWKASSAKARSAILRRWYELILANQEDLAVLMTAEQGKVLAESRGEVAYGASFIEWFAEEAKRVYGDVIPTPQTDRRAVVIKQPVGVVAAITPWNFPNAMITRKAGPALAVGCAIVLKPAAETPLSALALAELAERAGLPAGLFNVLPSKDAREVGGELSSNPIVKKLTFTGSTPVGKVLMKQCAETVKRTSMELGGNAPVLVFDDADLDQAVAGAIGSKYRNSGQTCICANRILVQDSVYDAFVEKFTAAVNGFKVGNGMDADSTHGPLITAKAVNDVSALVEDALAKGATATTGGQRGEQGDCFYQPTVLANVTDEMRVAREEIFGPVAPIFKFSSEAEAIAMANDTEFGLASYIYTRDIGRVWRVSEGIEYGMVGVNETAITSEVIPFGGVKESGQGREGSKYGLDDYLETKYICMGGLNG